MQVIHAMYHLCILNHTVNDDWFDSLLTCYSQMTGGEVIQFIELMQLIFHKQVHVVIYP